LEKEKGTVIRRMTFEHSMIIEFRKDFPELLQPEVERILKEYNWLIPNWVQRLFIGYDGSSEGYSCYVTMEHDYRFANLQICGHWARGDKSLMTEEIIHEIIHLHFSPFADYAKDTIKSLCGDNNTMFDIIEREIKSRNERVTQDFAWSIFNKFRKEKENG
jgi:hypothetical protein